MLNNVVSKAVVFKAPRYEKEFDFLPRVVRLTFLVLLLLLCFFLFLLILCFDLFLALMLVMDGMLV